MDNPAVAGLTMWSSFELVFLDILQLLVDETNRYANREKNKPGFKVSVEEMMNFIGLLFYLVITYANLREITGVSIQTSNVTHFQSA